MKDCRDISRSSVIAIGGITVSSSYDKIRQQRAIHIVSAFSAANELVLGQVKTDKKSNEITAIPGVYNLLDIMARKRLFIVSDVPNQLLDFTFEWPNLESLV